MIYLILITFLFALACIGYAFYAVLLIANQKIFTLSTGRHTVMTVEKAYRAVDYETSFIYIPEHDIIKNNIQNMWEKPQKVIANQEHLRRVAERSLFDLSRKLLEDRVVETLDQGYEDTMELRPFERKFSMRIKVYKP